MTISTDILKSERESLKEQLQTIEVDQRKAEGVLKTIRQKELRTKREIEAVTTLIDLAAE